MVNAHQMASYTEGSYLVCPLMLLLFKSENGNGYPVSITSEAPLGFEAI